MVGSKIGNRKVQAEIKSKIDELGLKLGTKIPNWPPTDLDDDLE